jgi:hypothetical protein
MGKTISEKKEGTAITTAENRAKSSQKGKKIRLSQNVKDGQNDLRKRNIPIDTTLMKVTTTRRTRQ